MTALERWKENIRPYYLRWCYFPLFPGRRPAYFRQCWRYPGARLTVSELRDRTDGERTRPNFLFLPMNDWHSRTQRSQHLAAALAARGHWCFYLNPHLGREYPSVRPAHRDPYFAVLRHGVIEIHVPLALEPVYHHRLLEQRESRAIARALEVLDSRGFTNTVQVVSLPTWLDAALLLRRRHGWPILYDCHDLLAGFDTMSPEIVNAENRAISEADFVVFTSEYLRDAMLRGTDRRAGTTAVVRNGVDLALFGGCLERRSRRRRTEKGGEKTIGYFGALENWFDCEMIRALACRTPQYRILLLGRVESRGVRSLAADLPNVNLVGEVPYQRLPDYLEAFDAALIPFRNTPLTRCADPIKLYEYFAAGLPVAATDLPEVEARAPLAYLASSPREFAEAVERAANEPPGDLPTRRAAFAQESGWDARAESLVSSGRRILGLDPGQ